MKTNSAETIVGFRLIWKIFITLVLFAGLYMFTSSLCSNGIAKSLTTGDFYMYILVIIGITLVTIAGWSGHHIIAKEGISSVYIIVVFGRSLGYRTQLKWEQTNISVNNGFGGPYIIVKSKPMFSSLFNTNFDEIVSAVALFGMHRVTRETDKAYFRKALERV